MSIHTNVINHTLLSVFIIQFWEKYLEVKSIKGFRKQSLEKIVPVAVDHIHLLLSELLRAGPFL
jgi:hypothetical protein